LSFSQDRATDLFEIDVDNTRAGFRRSLCELAAMAIDAGSETQFGNDKTALLGAAGNTDDVTTFEFCTLADPRNAVAPSASCSASCSPRAKSMIANRDAKSPMACVASTTQKRAISPTG
jgi:hypothetical protein